MRFIFLFALFILPAAVNAIKRPHYDSSQSVVASALPVSTVTTSDDSEGSIPARVGTPSLAIDVPAVMNANMRSNNDSAPSSSVLSLIHPDEFARSTRPRVGHYAGDIESPIAPGGRRRWNDFVRFGENREPSQYSLVSNPEPIQIEARDMPDSLELNSRASRRDESSPIPIRFPELIGITSQNSGMITHSTNGDSRELHRVIDDIFDLNLRG